MLAFAALELSANPVLTRVAPDCGQWEQRVSGHVIVEAEVSSDGSVRTTRVLKPFFAFDECAERAAKQWTFAPSADAPTRIFELSFFFVLTETEEPAGRRVVDDEDPLTVRIISNRSTILPLDPGEESRKQHCRVHDQPMARGLARIEYGLPFITMSGQPPDEHSLWRERYADAFHTLFPNANTRRGGGCMVGVERSARVFYCARCREAEAAWLKANPKPE